MRSISNEELMSVVGGAPDAVETVVGQKLTKDGAVAHKSMGVSNAPRSGSAGGRSAPAATTVTTTVTESVCTTPSMSEVNFSLNPVGRGVGVTVKGSTGVCTTTTRQTVTSR